MRLVHKIFTILLLLLLLTSCKNPFNPGYNKNERSRRIGFNPDTPENVLRNLMLAYNQKSIELYKDCLDVDFRFHVLSQHAPEIGFDWWGYEQEIEFHTNLFSRGSSDGSYVSPNSIILNLDIPPSDFWQIDNQIGQENWVIISTHFNLHLSFLSGNSITATGFARFHLKPKNERWYIAIWVDESFI